MLDNSMNDINPYIIHCGYLNSSNCPPSGTVYEKRTVKWHELELILWGEGYVITEGKKLLAKKGHIFYRKPGMVVQGVSPYYCYLIIFDMVFDRDRFSLYNENEIMNAGKTLVEAKYGITRSGDASDSYLSDIMNTMQFQRFKDLFEIIYNDFINHGGENQFFLKTHLMQIILQMHTEWSSTGILQNSSLSIRSNFLKIIAAREFINSRVASRVTLSEIAHATALSPNFLCRIFKSIMGQSPIEYMNSCKINLAKKLLNETNMSVKEISYECGFENDTYFYSLFKKVEEMTPSVYRQKQRTIFF